MDKTNPITSSIPPSLVWCVELAMESFVEVFSSCEWTSSADMAAYCLGVEFKFGTEILRVSWDTGQTPVVSVVVPNNPGSKYFKAKPIPPPMFDKETRQYIYTQQHKDACHQHLVCLMSKVKEYLVTLN